MQLLYDDLKNIEYIMNWSSLAINEEGLSTEVNCDEVCKRFFLKEIETMHLCPDDFTQALLQSHHCHLTQQIYQRFLELTCC